MNRYQILIEYIGTNFRGWQIQKKGPTIQGLIQEKLSKLLKEKIDYNTHVTLDKKYVLYSGDIVDNGIRKLS